MNNKLSFGLLTIVLILCLSGCCISHDWQDATCTAPKTCVKCDKTEGNVLEHIWMDATCTTPKTCSVCNTTEGDSLGHTWINATCTTPKTCDVCAITEGYELDHTWIDATCSTPKTCSQCGTTKGTTLEHNINYNTGKCKLCSQQIVTVTHVDKSDVLNYFTITYSNKSESPCTITVTPKTSGNTYSGTIFFNIYRGEKPTYGSSAKYANTYLDSASIALDKNGCGSTTVKFNDYSYHIRAEVDHSSVSFY